MLGSVYGFERPAIAGSVSMLLDHRQVSIQETDVVQAALDLYRKSRRLGFGDCMVLEIARKAGHIPLGTFDRALGMIDGAQRIG